MKKVTCYYVLQVLALQTHQLLRLLKKYKAIPTTSKITPRKPTQKSASTIAIIRKIRPPKILMNAAQKALKSITSLLMYESSTPALIEICSPIFTLSCKGFISSANQKISIQYNDFIHFYHHFYCFILY